jgi:hypothetical protein
MSTNNSIDRQYTLFEPESLHNIQVVKTVDGYDIPATYGKFGSYIDTAERATYLISALDAISQRNIRDGIALAAYTHAYSAPIWEHYQEGTRGVLDGASRNRNRYQQQLRTSFWKATGFAALRGSRLIRENQINPRAQKMWRDFNKLYGHPDALKERNKYKAVLKAQIRNSGTNRPGSLPDVAA